jgi:hypothetical protein
MQHPPYHEDDRPAFDEEAGQALVGKHVLVGVTVQDKRGEFKRQEQFHGTVVSAEAGRGIMLSLLGSREGEQKWLPPATNVFSVAPPGVYRLRATGEEVVNPDFTATWTLTQPDA